MEWARKSIAMAGVLMCWLAVDAEAQPWRFDFGVNGGGSWMSPILEEQDLGFDSDVDFDAGWLTGGHATLWLGNRFGLRANLAYADRSLAFDGDESFIGDNNDLIENVNLWTGTGDLMFRFVEPADEFIGFRMLPYFTLGAGVRWTNPAGDRFAIAGRDDDLFDDNNRTGAPFTVGDNTFFLEETASPAFRAGLGADARVSRNFALRLEVGDVLSETAIHRVEGDGPVFNSVEGNIGGLEHDLYATLGLNVLVGTGGTRTMTAALSAPRPEDRPLDTRTNVERRDTRAMDVEPVSICVADPASPEGLTILEAEFRPAQGDTVVVQQGRVITIREYVSHDPTMVENRNALIGERQVIQIETGQNPIVFEPSGEARAMSEGVVYVGNVNGVPLYAMKSDLRTLQSRLEETRSSQNLGEWLLTDPANARVFRSEVMRVYVPVERVGCVFRPLRQVGS